MEDANALKTRYSNSMYSRLTDFKTNISRQFNRKNFKIPRNSRLALPENFAFGLTPFPTVCLQ